MGKTMGRYINIQTLEEFTAEVKRQLIEEFLCKEDEEFESFFKSKDAQETIQRGFNGGLRRLKTGEITQRVFDIGRTSAVANCLYYMF